MMAIYGHVLRMRCPVSEFTDDTTPRLPLGLWFHPIYPLLYVGFVTENKLGVYE